MVYITNIRFVSRSTDRSLYVVELTRKGGKPREYDFKIDTAPMRDGQRLWAAWFVGPDAERDFVDYAVDPSRGPWIPLLGKAAKIVCKVEAGEKLVFPICIDERPPPWPEELDGDDGDDSDDKEQT